jgi:hypothetical protein
MLKRSTSMSIYTYKFQKNMCEILNTEYFEDQSLSDQEIYKFPENYKYIGTQPWNKGNAEFQRGEFNPFYGKKHSRETKKHWSAIRKGKKKSEEARQKLKGKIPWNKDTPWSDEVKRKMSLAKKDCFGDKNNFYGRRHSDDTKQLMSSLKKGILTGPCSEEKKANIAKARVGKRWYKNIDSSECVCCYPGQEPIGWIPGMVKKKLEIIS